MKAFAYVASRQNFDAAHLHRDPKLWLKPDEFWPERWMEGSADDGGSVDKGPSKVCKEAYFPFSEGSRLVAGAK